MGAIFSSASAAFYFTPRRDSQPRLSSKSQAPSSRKFPNTESFPGTWNLELGTWNFASSLDTTLPAPYCCGMNKVKKLLHTRYRVNDLDKTVKFYKDVLGLEEIRRNKSPRGSELVFLKTPGSEEQIEITYFPGSGPVQVQPDLTHLAFEVDNLEEFGKHLGKLGLKFSDGPTKSSSGSVFAFIDAPEGYEIELIEMAKGGARY